MTESILNRRYLAILFDTVGTIRMKIKKRDSYAVGYSLRPQLRISRPNSRQAVIDALATYCEDNEIHYRIEERTSRESVRLVVSGIKNTKQLLTAFRPDMVQQADAVGIMLDEIIPSLEANKHGTREGMLEVMASVDRLRATLRRDEDRKYDRAYFESEWEDVIA
jgi:hypothetical protein